ncbi:hypothetical protein VP01_346g7 [Puccinia sorghi]|uniref:Reverse transcriptase/retrotransposon-derived protein RNase H-like domain-containing protein n=1 Tax=Puccinia sorghi TaxID=27349 RepID=A0A0L6UW17_9BASI|nr:hypothetical protein VP01_346g7 [Puccinia sorghi]
MCSHLNEPEYLKTAFTSLKIAEPYKPFILKCDCS